jgi:hypothetical protein
MPLRAIHLIAIASMAIVAPAAFGQFTNGAAMVDVQLESDVQILYPSSAGGHISATGTMIIQRKNASEDWADLMITEMSLTGTLTSTLFPSPAPVTMEADLADETRSNNAGSLSKGPSSPFIDGLLDVYFSIFAETPVGNSTGFSALNQDNGLRAEPARLHSSTTDEFGAGYYELEQDGAGQNGNPPGTGLLFVTQNPDGTGISLLQIIGMQMILFNPQPVEIPPTLLSVTSHRTHGPAGAFDLDLNLDGDPTIEPRQDNGTAQLVFTFSENMSAIAPAPHEVFAITNGSFVDLVFDGNQVILSMTFTPNTCVTATSDMLIGIDSNLPPGEPVGVSLLAWPGNVNQDASANVIDLQDVKNHVFQPVDDTTFLFDMNVDGQINVLDLQETKNNLFSTVTCP